jgi:hypothetical protein
MILDPEELPANDENLENEFPALPHNALPVSFNQNKAWVTKPKPSQEARKTRTLSVRVAADMLKTEDFKFIVAKLSKRNCSIDITKQSNSYSFLITVELKENIDSILFNLKRALLSNICKTVNYRWNIPQEYIHFVKLGFINRLQEKYKITINVKIDESYVQLIGDMDAINCIKQEIEEMIIEEVIF